MRVALTLLLLALIIGAMQIEVNVEYSDPIAIKYLRPPSFSVSITGTLNLSSPKIGNLNITIGNAPQALQTLLKQRLIASLSKCPLSETPLISVLRCVMDPIMSVIGVNETFVGAVSLENPSLLPNGHFIETVRYQLTLISPLDAYRGISIYKVEGGSRGFEEELQVLLTGNHRDSYIKVVARTVSDVGNLAEYYLLKCRDAIAIIDSVNPSNSPQVLRNGDLTRVVFPYPTVRYVLIVSKKIDILPRTSWQYYSKLARELTVPLSCSTIERINAIATSEYALNCQSDIVIASKGMNEVTLGSLKGLKIVAKVPSFVDLKLAIPCNGSAVMNVNNSTLFVPFEILSKSKLIVVPEAPVLKLVEVKSKAPFKLILKSKEIWCPATCYLALPPKAITLTVTSLNGTRLSRSFIVAPQTKVVEVTLPKSVAYAACGSFLVAPRPINVDFYFNNTLVRLTIGPNPKYVLLPCNTTIGVNVNNSYQAQIRINGNTWIAFCPGEGVTSGHVVDVKSMLKPPISISCDNGRDWLIIKSSTFKLVVPDYPVISLRAVGSDDSEANLLVPLGIKEIVLPVLTRTKKKVSVAPPLPLTEMVDVKLHGAEEGTLTLSLGNYSITYAIQNRTVIALPKSWVTSRISAMLSTNVNGIMKLINFTLPALRIGNVTANVEIFVNGSYVFYNYHTARIVIEDPSGNLTDGIITIDGKYKVKVHGVTVIVYPRRIVKIWFNGNAYNVALNGQTIYLKVPLQKGLSTLDSYIVIKSLRPVRAKIELTVSGETLTYNVSSNVTYLAVPSSWLSKYITMTIVTGGYVHRTTLPPLLTTFNNTAVVSDVYMLVNDSPQYNYYSTKIIATYEGLNAPANVTLKLDGKYYLEVNGSAVLVYPRKVITVEVLNKTLEYNIEKNAIVIKVPYKRKLPQSAPPYPLNVPIEVKLIGTKRTKLVLTDGKYSLTYEVTAPGVSIMIPNEWLKRNLTLIFDNSVLRGVQLSYNNVPASLNLILKKNATRYYYATIVTQSNGKLTPTTLKINGVTLTLNNGVGVVVYPKNTVYLEIGGSKYEVKLNGTVVTLEVPPTRAIAPVNATLSISIYRNGRPYEATIELSNNGISLKYYVRGTATVMVPYSWLTSNLTLRIIENNGLAHRSVLPPLLISSGLRSLVAPVVVYLDNPAQYNYYSSIIEIVEKRGLFGNLASAQVVIDDKYTLKVNGAVALVYPNKTITIEVDGKKVVAPLGNSIIKIAVTRKAKQAPQGNKTAVIEAVLPKLMKTGVIKPWNPWRGLPSVALLSTSLLISLGIASATQNPTNLVQAFDFAFNALSLVLTAIALSV